MLTERRKRFAFHYARTGVGTRSAIAAGYAEDGANVTAVRLLSDATVLAEIEEQKRDLAALAVLSPAWVLRRWMEIADADPNDLVRVVNEACRNCYDESTRAEFVSKGWEHMLKTINPACKLCEGHGVRLVIVADSTKLKGPAKRLYAGAKQTKDGIEVKMRDQDAALKNIAGYFGMLVERKELSGPGGSPIAIEASSKPLGEMTEAELMEMISRARNVTESANSGVDLGVQPQLLPPSPSESE